MAASLVLEYYCLHFHHTSILLYITFVFFDIPSCHKQVLGAGLLHKKFFFGSNRRYQYDYRRFIYDYDYDYDHHAEGFENPRSCTVVCRL
jgi:hypothetical protein